MAGLSSSQGRACFDCTSSCGICCTCINTYKEGSYFLFLALQQSNMVSIRPANVDDLLSMQNTNLWCLPENYNMKYYYYHILSWPQLLHVAEDHKGKVVGYVLAKMEEEDSPTEKHGHVTSLSVLRTHRKCGLATQLMNSSHKRMVETFDANCSALHVRETNHAAFHLYSQTLQYEIHEVEKGYYADGEDAYDMRKYFKAKKGPSPREIEQQQEQQKHLKLEPGEKDELRLDNQRRPLILTSPDTPPPPPGVSGDDEATRPPVGDTGGGGV